MAPVLHAATMARNIASITQLVVSQNYAGMALDYEGLQAGDRTAFTAFVQQLGASLHAAHKTLAVSLFAKTDDAGDDPRDVAQDHAAIGAAADQVWLMTYDYHWDTSPPGPVAPAGWVHDVLAYATTLIPPQKLSVGLDTAGYDWVGNQGQVISYAQAMQLATSHGVAVQFDPTSQAPWVRYTAPDGAAHEGGREHRQRPSQAVRGRLVRSQQRLPLDVRTTRPHPVARPGQKLTALRATSGTATKPVVPPPMSGRSRERFGRLRRWVGAGGVCARCARGRGVAGGRAGGRARPAGPGSESVAARLAEWGRDHGFGPLVTWLEGLHTT